MSTLQRVVVENATSALRAAEVDFLRAHGWTPKVHVCEIVRWTDPEDGSEWTHAEALKLLKSRVRY
jgi:hypothetical protein